MPLYDANISHVIIIYIKETNWPISLRFDHHLLVPSYLKGNIYSGSPIICPRNEFCLYKASERNTAEVLKAGPN